MPLLQKRFVGLMAGKRGWYHADPLCARFGVLVAQARGARLEVMEWKTPREPGGDAAQGGFSPWTWDMVGQVWAGCGGRRALGSVRCLEFSFVNNF